MFQSCPHCRSSCRSASDIRWLSRVESLDKFLVICSAVHCGWLLLRCRGRWPTAKSKQDDRRLFELYHRSEAAPGAAEQAQAKRANCCRYLKTRSTEWPACRKQPILPGNPFEPVPAARRLMVSDTKSVHPSAIFASREPLSDQSFRLISDSQWSPGSQLRLPWEHHVVSHTRCYSQHFGLEPILKPQSSQSRNVDFLFYFMLLLFSSLFFFFYQIQYPQSRTADFAPANRTFIDQGWSFSTKVKFRCFLIKSNLHTTNLIFLSYAKLVHYVIVGLRMFLYSIQRS